MDPLTHGLASLAVQRGFFPRASWRTVLAIVFAGVIADLDSFSASFGPLAYLRWHRTATHSLLFAMVLAFAAFLFSKTRRDSETLIPWKGFSWVPILTAAALHLLMDVLQPDAIVPLWPFSPKRISLDIVPAIDPWLLMILAAAILLPELVHLVSDEIGSRAKRPRGRNGAIAGLAFALIYFGLRAVFHGNVTGTLEARTIAGALPHSQTPSPHFFGTALSKLNPLCIWSRCGPSAAMRPTPPESQPCANPNLRRSSAPRKRLPPRSRF